MKLFCLSDDPNQPCFVLKFNDVMFMLDCSLDMLTLMHYLPASTVHSSNRASHFPVWQPAAGERPAEELKECGGRILIDSLPQMRAPKIGIVNLSQVDVVLISNYQTMLALPYITEHGGFRGKVYATDPTIQSAKQLMNELATFFKGSSCKKNAKEWKRLLPMLPTALKDAVADSLSWRFCYSPLDVESCLSKIQLVAYNETVDVYGCLKFMAVSSGYAIGSCNWVIKSSHEKIAYISGSSTLTTHPRPMEHTSLRHSDIIILSSLTQVPLANPDAMMGDFCTTAAGTLRNGGNVLVPCSPCGVIYDLFECLASHLDTHSMSNIPLYFISPAAEASLAYSNIYAEWLSSGKMSKVYLPEQPFPHGELLANNRLRHFPSVHGTTFNDEFRTPCVVFVSHPSLRCGDVVHFMELWGGSSSNTLILTEPHFPYLDALAPYQPLHMRVVNCPIDTRLSFAQANKLLRDLKAQRVVAHERYLRPPLAQPTRTDLALDIGSCVGIGGNLMTYRGLDVIQLPLRRNYAKAHMTPELAAALVPAEIKPGVAVVTVMASVTSRDNRLLLEPLSTDGQKTKRQKLEKHHVWGTVNVKDFLANLSQAGLADVKVEDLGEGDHIFHLPNDDTLIHLDSSGVHIMCEGKELVRGKIRDALLKCLHRL